VAPAAVTFARSAPATDKLATPGSGVILAPTGINQRSGFTGLNFSQSGGYVPPDTCGAAGPTCYVETVNQAIEIFKSGPDIMDSLDHFFFTVGGLTRASGSSLMSSPVVIYDELIGCFIVGDQDVDFSTHVSNFVIAVSKGNTPDTLTASDWNFYSISTTETGFDADYPGNLGYNADALVFTLNMFKVSTMSNDHVQVRSVNASDLKNGVSQASLHVFKTDLASFSLRPTTMHDASAGDPMWFVTEHGDYTSIDVIKMTNVLSSPASFAATNETVE
jgi:hypothetical protein